MDNEMNSIIKLLTIISNSDGITIRELNAITGIPMEFIKRDLEYISSNNELYFFDLYTDDETGQSSDCYMDIKWRIDDFPEGVRVLSLNSIEKYLFKTMVSHGVASYDGFLGISTKSAYGIEDYKYKICQITLSIKSRRRLNVKYRSMDGVIHDFIIEPLGTVFYEFDNMLYVLGQYNGEIATYRLDRMISIKETRESFTPLKGFEIGEYLKSSWGMEQGEEVKVKVKFIKTGNVLYRVKRDLECRKNKKLVEYSDCIIYEDIVTGINSFKRWLRAYGGAAIVLEPEELKNQMISSAKQCLKYYLEEED